MDVRPRALFSNAALLPVLVEVLPDAELDADARARGGVDFRAMDDFAAAGYPDATVLLAHQVVDPAKIEAAFANRVADVQGRAIDRASHDPRGTLVRVWGARGKERESAVTFGREAVGLAVGDDARLRAAELFAQGKLRRAKPAWRVAPLDRMGELLGDASFRAAAPGPFAGAWADGLGGFLASATAAGLAIRLESGGATVTAVLTGAWGDRAVEAEERLRNSYDALAGSGLGGLLGLERPLAPATFTSAPDHVALDIRLGVPALVRGLSDATSTALPEFLRRPVR